jgi:tetratricopeptide (TPR) repeat protein
MEYKMKNVKIALITILLFFVSIQSIIAQGEVNLIAEFSLFYESYKNKDYESAEPHGWIVIDTDPSQFLKYRPFKKMEDIMIFMHDSVATTKEQKDEYIAKALKLYDKALIAGEKDSSYFTMKKAYVIDEWSDITPDEKISAYLYALEKFPNSDPFYKDRLGTLYANNATDGNGYKLKALEVYLKLAEEDSENETWNSRITNLAEDMTQLVEYMKKAWDLDKENMEKAWKYAEMCQKAEEFEKAIEPLEFLVKKNPEVVTYHRKLTTLYQKVGSTDDAIKTYKTIIELDPANRDNYYNLAIIYSKLDQLSVARSYLQKATKASNEPWDLPIYMEAQLYEKAASQSGSFEFMDKCVYKLAADTYSQAAKIGGSMSSSASDRVQALQNSVPQKEDYFFKKIKPGTSIRIEGGSYGWIGRSITSR